MHALQVFPTNGTKSSSLWDAPDISSLQEWLDEFLDAECNSEVFQVKFATSSFVAPHAQDKFRAYSCFDSFLGPPGWLCFFCKQGNMHCLSITAAGLNRLVVMQIQEQFAFGISAELTRVRATEKVRLPGLHDARSKLPSSRISQV